MQSSVPSDALNQDLNEVQENLAASIISNANCCYCESVDLVWGLPGTGKTRTISIALAALLKSKIQTLCVPPVFCIAQH